MQTDFLQFIFQAINTLLTQNLGFFDTMGQNLFRWALPPSWWPGLESKSALCFRLGPARFPTLTILPAYF